jgi:hypothetical protein
MSQHIGMVFVLFTVAALFNCIPILADDAVFSHEQCRLCAQTGRGCPPLNSTFMPDNTTIPWLTSNHEGFLTITTDGAAYATWALGLMAENPLNLRFVSLFNETYCGKTVQVNLTAIVNINIPVLIHTGVVTPSPFFEVSFVTFGPSDKPTIYSDFWNHNARHDELFVRFYTAKLGRVDKTCDDVLAFFQQANIPILATQAAGTSLTTGKQQTALFVRLGPGGPLWEVVCYNS